MSDELSFNSKIDLWLLILVLAGVSVCVWGLAESWNGLIARDLGLAVLVIALLALGVALPLWILISLRYFLSDDMLRIRCGPFRWQVQIGEITAIDSIRSPYSSPAMSLDRLRIEYGDGRSVMISPEPRAEFLRQIEHRRKLSGA